MAPYSPLPPNAKPRPMLHIRPYPQDLGPTPTPTLTLNLPQVPMAGPTPYRRPPHERALLERGRWMVSLAVCCMIMVCWMVASPETRHLDRVVDVDLDRSVELDVRLGLGKPVAPGAFVHVHKARAGDATVAEYHWDSGIDSSMAGFATSLSGSRAPTLATTTTDDMASTQALGGTTPAILASASSPARSPWPTPSPSVSLAKRSTPASTVFSNTAEADQPSAENTDQARGAQPSPSPSSSPADSDADPQGPGNTAPVPQGGGGGGPEATHAGKVEKRRSRVGRAGGAGGGGAGAGEGSRWVWVERGMLELELDQD